MLLNFVWFNEAGAVRQRVIKGHQIVVYDATSTCKNRGSMDLVHERGSMYPVHGGGPWTRGPCFVLSHKSVFKTETALSCAQAKTIHVSVDTNLF